MVNLGSNLWQVQIGDSPDLDAVRGDRQLARAADHPARRRIRRPAIDALREYAEDWQDHLLDAPNHRENRGLVQLISLSTDDQLRDWLVGAER